MRSRAELREAYKLRLKRRHLLWRAFRSRHGLRARNTNRPAKSSDAIYLFATMRNESQRLPHFLAHYRNLGIAHFFIVENGSDDGTDRLLLDQPDVSLWTTTRSYKAARFGMDWMNWLLWKFGRGHWCLTVDADELLVYPDHDTRPLPDLTAWLDAQGARAMGAMMLDLYPKGPLSGAQYRAGEDPTVALPCFDATGYTRTALPRFQAVSIRGGVRQRVFFTDQPERAPHLHKTPLIRWHWRDAYLSSTHIVLPPASNRALGDPSLPTGALLHTKFLDGIIHRSAEEKARREHFTYSEAYDRYYDAIIADPDLTGPPSAEYRGPAQLESLGLIRRGAFSPK